MSVAFLYKPREKKMFYARLDEYQKMNEKLEQYQPPQPEPPSRLINYPLLNYSSLQENLMNLICFDDEAALEIRSQAETQYLFEGVQYRHIISKAFEYIDRYNRAPGEGHINDLLEDKLHSPDHREANLYKTILENMHALSKVINREYVLDKLNLFLRQARLKHGIIKAANFLQIDKPDSLEKAEAKLQEALAYMPSQSADDEIMYTDLAIVDEEAYSFLPLLNHEGFFVKNWSHIVSAYPKTGKTELLTRVLTEWPKETILYFTEESKEIWKARWNMLPDRYRHHHHIKLVFSREKTAAEILQRVRQAHETVIIIDTVNELLGIKDESNNSEIRSVLRPYINACTQKKQTFIGTNHDRKSGGQHGKAVSGGAAFVGAVDRIIEMNWEGENNSSKRLLTSLGRIFQTQPLVYELQNYVAVALGSPKDVSLSAVKVRCKEFLNDEWQETSPISEAVKASYKKDGLEPPSDEQIRKALKELVNDREAERDPPIKENDKVQGKRIKWRIWQSRTSGQFSTSLPT